MEREAFEHNSPLRNDVAARVDGFERARGLVAELQDGHNLKDLFDHLVGAGEECGWDGETEPASGPQVDEELEPRRLLDRHVGGARALEDFVRMRRDTVESRIEVWAVGQEATLLDHDSALVHGRHADLLNERGNPVRIRGEK